MFRHDYFFPLFVFIVFSLSVFTGQYIERPKAHPEDYARELRAALNSHFETTLPDTVFINQWASWCRSCMQEKPALEKIAAMAKENENSNITFVTINTQTTEEAEKSAPNPELFLNVFEAGTSLTTALQAIMGFTNSIPINVVIAGDKIIYKAGFTNDELQVQLEQLLLQ